MRSLEIWYNSMGCTDQQRFPLGETLPNQPKRGQGNSERKGCLAKLVNNPPNKKKEDPFFKMVAGFFPYALLYNL